MKPTFVKKNTKGGAAGITWEAGEVKALNPYLAEQLVQLAPEDYCIVQVDPNAAEKLEAAAAEEKKEAEEAEAEARTPRTLDSPRIEAEKPKAPVKKSNKKTETPSAE